MRAVLKINGKVYEFEESVFEPVLGYQDYELCDAVKGFDMKLEVEIDRTLYDQSQEMIADLEDDKEELKDKIREIEFDIEDLEDENGELKKEVKTLKDKIEALEAELKEYKDKEASCS